METATRLAAFNAEASIFNPLDVASFGGSRNAEKTAPILAKDTAIDAVIAFVHKLQTPPQRDGFTAGLVKGFRETGKPHLIFSPGGLPGDQRVLFENSGVPVFENCSSAIDGLSALFDVCALPSAPSADMPSNSTKFLGESVVLNEFESMAVLDRAGIHTVSRRLVDTASAAVAFSEEAGWPLVLKGVVDGVAHKSDVGLVRLNINTPEMLRDQFNELSGTINRFRKGTAQASSICIQKMMRVDLEVIAGVTREEPLGCFLVVGLGGRFAEQIDDVHLWAIPAGERAIHDQLATTAVGQILLSTRWGRRQSFDDLVEVLMNLQKMVLSNENRLAAVEINPLMFGEGAPVALDALVVSYGR